MIYIQSPLKREFIGELLNGNTINGYTFTLVKTEGMKLYFETSGEGDDAAALAIAKDTIKKSEFGSVLYFNSGVE